MVGMKTGDADRVLRPVSGCLKASPRGALLLIKVYPGSERSLLDGMTGERLRVRVRARPEKDRANREALSLLSRALGIPVSRLEIVHGKTSRDKTVLLHNLEVAQAESKLSSALTPGE